jgi:hypothetical protein
MESFNRYAFFTLTRDAAFFALAAATLMVGFSFDPPLAFDIGAHVALTFALILLIRAVWIDENRIIRSEPWVGLDQHERPAGVAGVRGACDQMELLLLRFAKTAAGLAGALYGTSMIASLA